MPKIQENPSPLVLRCELDDVVLMRCECERIGSEEQEIGPFELKFDASVLELRFEDKRLRADVATKVQSISDSGKLMFELLVVFRLMYLVAGKEPSQRELREFEKETPVFHAWPYLREMVQNLTQRMQFNPPPLPLIKRRPPIASVKQKATAKRK